MATSTADLLKRMTDLEHQDVEKTFRGMLYGPPGGGKTTLAAGLAQRLAAGRRILYIDSAEGWVSLDNIPSLKSNMTHIQYRDYADLPALATALQKQVKGFENFGVVVIDELSSICDDVLEVVVREKHGTRPEEPTPEVEGSDYKPMGDLIISAVKKFLSVPDLHVILVAHARTDTDRRKVTKTAPSISPKLRQSLNGLMHVTAHVTAEIGGIPTNPTYTRSVQPMLSALVEAKTRVGGLQIKMDFKNFVDSIGTWVESGQIQQDLAEAEGITELAPDEIPTDGLPLVEGDIDDEPVFVAEEA